MLYLPLKSIFIYCQKWFLLVLLISLMILFVYFNLDQYLNFQSIKTYQSTIQHWTTHHYSFTIAFYMLSFTLLIACTIPCATFFTMVGGFLFGMIAIAYALLSITLGGLLLFFAIRTSVGSHIANKSTGWIKIMEYGFQKNAFQYIVLLRLIPVSPCWISNIAAGALNVPIKTFIVATILGVLPTTVISVVIGRNLDHLLLEKKSIVEMFLASEILFPLILLIFLCVFPIIYQRLKWR